MDRRQRKDPLPRWSHLEAGRRTGLVDVAGPAHGELLTVEIGRGH
jgi:hypothetical protein